MNVQKAALLIILGVLSIVGFIFISFDMRNDTRTEEFSKDIEIVRTWNLPKILDEVSGIAVLDAKRMAAVQDEDGIIFIYNLENESIEKKIEFAGSGDYEGIALAGTTAFVLRSDGTIYEVSDFMSGKGETAIHETSVKGKFNFEGLSYDKENNRLLMAVKEEAKGEFKPVYAFNLKSKSLQEEPVMKIRFDDPVFEVLDQKKSEKIIRPSEINIHPETGEIYILEGVSPKLVIADSNGKFKKLHILSKKQFSQAEGLTFGASGEMYISNEGKGGKANILQVKLN